MKAPFARAQQRALVECLCLVPGLLRYHRSFIYLQTRRWNLSLLAVIEWCIQLWPCEAMMVPTPVPITEMMPWGACLRAPATTWNVWQLYVAIMRPKDCPRMSVMHHFFGSHVNQNHFLLWINTSLCRGFRRSCICVARVVGWANRKIQPEDPTLSFFSVVKKARHGWKKM